jgi:hypothetical protein
MGNSHAQARPLRFVELEGGCWVPLSHQLNQDGYFRKTWKKEGGGRVAEMFHRFIFRAHAGLDAIPNGHEVDHMCGNRACAAPNHLQLLKRTHHLEATNRERYAVREAAARLVWQWRGCTGTRLADLFGVTISTACRWIRKWKAEAA